MAKDPQDPQLFSAWKRFAEAAAKLLLPHYEIADPDDIGEETLEWVPDSDATNAWWRRKRRRRSWIWPLIEEHDAELQALPEYEECLAALRANELIAPQLGAVVGTVLSASRLDEAELIESILQQMVMRKGSVTFDEGTFDEAYEYIESSLYASDVHFEMVAPFALARFERLPINLGPDLVIENMSEEEASLTLNAGFLAPMTGLTGSTVLRNRAAVKHRYSLPKRVSPATDQDDDDNGESHQEVMELFEKSQRIGEAVLCALRLVHHGVFSIPGAVHLARTWFDEDEGPRIEFLQGSSRQSLMTATFSAKACDEIEFFFNALQETRVKKHRGLVQASRRFGYAMENHREEDRIVDVMIAAEALFLSDAGSAQDRGELKYRLSLRAAYFMGKDADERTKIFKFMKAAYDARSTIAHGGQPSSFRDLEGNEIDAHQFSHFTSHYVRRALRQAIREAPANGPFMDWEGLILSGAGPT